MGKKFYLTRRKLEKIQKEHDTLIKIRNIKAKKGVPSFMHSEDLDPEYISFAEDAELLDMRISDLDYILKNSEIISQPPKEKRNVVGLGAKIILEVGGDEDEFEVTGTLEANPSLGKISDESPVGKALLGHKVGDEIIISSPIKTFYKIKKIQYPKD